MQDKEELVNYKRALLFQHYDKRDNPFIILTTKIDVTNLIYYCKTHKNYYATIGYAVVMAMNTIDEFRVRYEDNKFYKYKKINANFVQSLPDETIGFFSFELKEKLHDFVAEFKKAENILLQNPNDSSIGSRDCELWMSCSPWFSFSALIPPFDKKELTPQVIWDRYELVGERYYMNFMIMIHHGLADGQHIGQFVNKLQEIIDNFNQYIV